MDAAYEVVHHPHDVSSLLSQYRRLERATRHIQTHVRSRRRMARDALRVAWAAWRRVHIRSVHRRMRVAWTAWRRVHTRSVHRRMRRALWALASSPHCPRCARETRVRRAQRRAATRAIRAALLRLRARCTTPERLCRLQTRCVQTDPPPSCWEDLLRLLHPPVVA